MWWGRLSSFWPRLLVDVSFLLRPLAVFFGCGGIVPPILLLVRSPGDYLAYGAVLALVACGNNVLNILRLRREVDFRLAGRPDLRRHLSSVVSFGSLSIASAVYLSHRRHHGLGGGWG